MSSIYDSITRTIKGFALYRQTIGWTNGETWSSDSTTRLVTTKANPDKIRLNTPFVNETDETQTLYFRSKGSTTAHPSDGSYLRFTDAGVYNGSGSLGTYWNTSFSLAAGYSIYFYCDNSYANDYDIEYSWDNTNWTTINGSTRKYYNVEITYDECFGDGENISMGQACINECKVKFIEPEEGVVDYNLHPFTIGMDITTGSSTYNGDTIQKFYPSEVTYNDDGSIEIDAYDGMSKMNVAYTPSISSPYSPQEIVGDILDQRGFRTDYTIPGITGGTRDRNQLLENYGHTETITSTNVLYPGTIQVTKIGDTTGVPGVQVSTTSYTTELIDVQVLASTTVYPYQRSSTYSMTNGHTYYLFTYCKNINNINQNNFVYACKTMNVRLTPGTSSLTYKENGYFEVDDGIVLYSRMDVTSSTWGCSRVRFSGGTSSDGGLVSFNQPYNIYFQLVDYTQYCNDHKYISFKEMFDADTLLPQTTSSTYTFGTTFNTLYEGTCQEYLGWMAGLSGKNAIFRDADEKLYFTWYDNNLSYSITRDMQCENGVSLDKASTTISSLTSGTEDNPIVAGTGKGITFYNPFMSQSVLSSIWSAISSESWLTYFAGKFKDFGATSRRVFNIKNITDKNNDVKTFLPVSQTWTINGGMTCEAESKGNSDTAVAMDTSNRGTITQKLSTLQETQKEFSNLINSAEGGCITWIDNNNDGTNDGLKAANDPTNPTKYLILNYNGIGLSNNGSTVYQNAITQDGIVADAITAGTITGIAINNGSGTFSVDNSGNVIANSLSSNNATITGGHIWIDTTSATYDAIKLNYQGEYVQMSPNYIKCGTNNSPYLSTQISDAGFFGNKNGSQRSFIGVYDAGHGVMYLDNSSGSATIFLNGANGNISCNGTAYLGGNNDYGNTVNVTGTVGANGNMYAPGFINTSRAEYKTDIKPSTDMLELVKDTEIYEYKYISEKDEGIDKIHHSIVIGDDYKHTPTEIIDAAEKGVNAVDMCSVLWKAVQELTAKVEALEAQLEGEVE